MEDAEESTVGGTLPQAVSGCRLHSDEAVEKQLMSQIDTHSECGSETDSKGKDAFNKNSKKVLVMITITFLFFFVELVVGFMNRSIALLADSYHMLSDVMALVIAFVCLRISRRKSKRNGFGWVRAEVLGALVNGVFLLAMCFAISLESIGRLIHSRRISHPLQVLVVGCIGLFINMIGIGMFHGGHGHSHGGGGHGHSHGEKPSKSKEETAPIVKKIEEEVKDADDDEFDSDSDPAFVNRPGRSRSRIGQDCSHNHLALKLVNLDENAEIEEFTDSEAARRKQKQANAQNLNMRGVFLHILSDAIGSVFVIITASLALFFPNSLGALNDYLDPALSLTLVTLICFSAYSLVRETASIILRRTPAFLDLDDMKADIMKIRGVAGVQSLCAWTLVGNRHLATADIEFCTPASFDTAAPKIRKVFHKHGIHSLTIQPIFSSNTCFNGSKLPVQTLDVIKEDVNSMDTPLLDEIQQ
nr:Cation efflux protein domain containing protein [Haemonchus contortus]